MQRNDVYWWNLGWDDEKAANDFPPMSSDMAYENYIAGRNAARDDEQEMKGELVRLSCKGNMHIIK